MRQRMAKLENPVIEREDEMGELRAKHKLRGTLKVVVVALTCLIFQNVASAQSTNNSQQHHDENSVNQQLNQLKAQVSNLEKVLAQQKQPSQASPANTHTGSSTTPSMPMGNMGGMMSNMMGMMQGMMGPMGKNQMAALSALPGFPGASHIYHIGSTNFFLDHPEHLSLSIDQQSKLVQIRDQEIAKQNDFGRKIDAFEEELWQLTASDQPNLSSIEAKVRESEKLKGDQRISFIKSVGEAAKVLTNEQRTMLLGHLSSSHSQPEQPPAPANQMGDM